MGGRDGDVPAKVGLTSGHSYGLQLHWLNNEGLMIGLMLGLGKLTNGH